jgi:hypothetical protein
MNFVSAFQLFMGSLSLGLIIILVSEASSMGSGFHKAYNMMEGAICYIPATL